MIPTLTVFIVLILMSWVGALVANGSGAGSLPWAVYDQALYLSGLLAIGLMSLAMVLATRPAWLERPLGGMDRIYRTHKWSGILAAGFAALHWLCNPLPADCNVVLSRSRSCQTAGAVGES